MHKYQNMKGENETLVSTLHCCFHNLSAPDALGLRVVPFPTRRERESLPCRLIRHKDSPQGRWINLPLAKTEPTGREQVQNTIVIGFLKMLPDVLARSPQTQRSARGMARSHEH